MICADTIANGNCLDLFGEVQDGSIDVTFADPPFNLEKDYSGYKDNLAERDYLDWCEIWIRESVRVLRPGGSLFLHNIPKWLIKYACMLDNMDMEFRHWIAWDAPTSPMGNSLQPAHYGIIYYTKRGAKHTFHEIRKDHERCRECKVLKPDYGGKKDTIPPFGPLLGDVWVDISRLKHHKYRNKHPCQLPVSLLERILLMSSESGDVVLDPFMGSGTTAVAARRLGRKFIGFEKDAGYAEMGMGRVARQTIPSRLGELYVSVFNGNLVTVRHDDVQADKEYRDAWKVLWEEWPETPDQRRALNGKKMKLKPEYAAVVTELSEKLRENEPRRAEVTLEIIQDQPADREVAGCQSESK